MELTGQTALITGGASGLGLATARTLAREGAKVIIVDLPSSNGEQMAAQLGVGALFVSADVRSEDQLAAALDSAGGDLRVVVSCAGVAPPSRILGRRGVHDLEDFRRVVDINLVGTFNVLRLAAQRMATLAALDGERGVAVMTASIAAFDGQVGQAAYSASKAGVVGLTLTAARDLSEHLIRVVSIAPGIFETPMLLGLPEPVQTALAAQVPHPSRLGRPDEFAALVAHIVRNPMLNGATIRLDGAVRMPPA
jgi:NAD(P)-dependent dehydrogenase (short-subunit alcohol dehydrogenase family)